MPVTLLYVVVVAIWGSSWLGIKFQLGVVAPELSIVYRFLLAAGILLVFCVVTRRRLRFSRRDHLFFAAQGLTLFSLNYLLFYVAAGYVTSGLLAVAFSTITVMNIGNGALFFHTPTDRRVVFAALAGIVGLGLVYWPEIVGVELSHAALIGLGLSIVATYLASLGNMVSVRHKAQAIPVIEANALGMSYGAGFALLFAIGRGAPFAFDWSAGYVLSLVYLALFASVFGFGAYLTLLQKIGADRAAYSSVLFPLVALGLSTLVEGYRWTPLAAIGVALVLAGNLVVLRRPKPTPAS
jgi:drug/metabolite transporter (DMT)-like permease